MTRVTVLGASGTTGSLVARGLRTLGHDVRAASRTSPVHFDWGYRSTWAQAVGDSTAVYVIADERPGGVDRLREFLRLAAQRDVERVVLLSARDWIDTDLLAGHFREQALQGSGLEWTIIRPAWFAQDFHTIECFAHGIRHGRFVHASGDGATPFVHATDIADVAVAALTESGHDGRAYELSGPRSLTVTEAVQVISETIGRPVTVETVDEGSYRRYLRELGLTDDDIHNMLFFCRVMQRGELDYLSSGVEEALGRPATAFEDYAASAVDNALWAEEVDGPDIGRRDK
jgi:uncharacterized protein YbjT (DUF2867 family)